MRSVGQHIRMTTLQSFLKAHTNREARPAKGQAGEHSDWLPFYDLKLKGGALQFVEMRVLGLRGERHVECVEVPVAPGAFEVQCRAARFAGDVRISAMRAFPQGVATHRGRKLKKIPVDLGGIAVVDIEAIHPSMQEDEDRYQEWIEDLLYETESDLPVSVAKWEPTKTDIPCVDGGFGDGSYPVLELVSGGKVVGLEAVFIEEDATFPF